MKRIRLFSSVVVFASIASFSIAKPKKHPGPPPQQQPSPPAPPATPAGPQPPSVRLFTAAHLDAILSSVDQRPQLPRAEISQLRASLTDEMAKTPEAERGKFTSAIAVCIALNGAMDEREQTIASIQSSAAVQGPSDLGARRKDVSVHGGRGAARLARIEKREEAHEDANRKQEAARKDDFLTQQHKNAWAQRALQIRQHIQMLITRQIRPSEVSSLVARPMHRQGEIRSRSISQCRLK